MANDYKNPFKELDKKLLEVPPEMRQKVMNDVAIAKLILEMAILVTSNYASIFSGMFKTNTRK
ncbi:MAG: hypothetical protein HKP38_12570 [Croceitalea sp.]|nr:hypothetical protein [Croceitalea sp.]MBT8237463.1 hypothetical protein [Croceitalea sp.]NNC35119.1 hypothetical protein [Croceitalea sp.]NNL10048.1 hypothetical protein [Croceitalea sp.]NNM19382.1 hypothetical protein [Croceitalea sp.]